MNAYEHNDEIDVLIAYYGKMIGESLAKRGRSVDQCQRWLDRVKELRTQYKRTESASEF